MRNFIALSGVLLGVGILAGLPAAADTTTTASGIGANVAIVSGNNGGTTVIIDSERPCRTESGKTAARRSSGSNSTTITSGPGGLSGSTTAGPSGTSVTIGSGSGGTVTSTSAGSNVAAGGECVVIIRSPAAK